MERQQGKEDLETRMKYLANREKVARQWDREQQEVADKIKRNFIQQEIDNWLPSSIDEYNNIVLVEKKRQWVDKKCYSCSKIIDDKSAWGIFPGISCRQCEVADWYKYWSEQEQQ